MVVDIQEAYGLILRRDWSMKLNGYFHMWLPFQNDQNMIKILRDPHMKHNVTQLEGMNQSVNFSSSVLGNYFLELELRNYQANRVQESDMQSELLRFSWTDDIDCNIVDLVTNVGDATNSVNLEYRFWVLYFDGSKTQEG